MRAHAEEPFLLYHPSQLPHGPISIPEVDPAVRDVPGLTDFEKEYASMVLRLDKTVGVILDELEKLGIDDETLIMFCSDNGHECYYREEGRCSGRSADINGVRYDNVDYTFYSERSGDVFNGNDGMAGCKLSSLEGGPRIPYLVRWTGHAAEGGISDALIANYDFLATVSDIVGAEAPSWKDGQSLVPAYEGRDFRRGSGHVVFAGVEGPALVSEDGWKVRYIISRRRFQLFHIAEDYREENDLAAAFPEKVRELGTRMLMECDGNFQHGTAENHKAPRIDQYMAGQAPEEAFPVHTHVLTHEIRERR